MSNVDELVEEVARVIDPRAFVESQAVDRRGKPIPGKTWRDETRVRIARDKAKAAIKAVLWGIRGMKIPDTQSPDNLEHRTLDSFALDALLKQLED